MQPVLPDLAIYWTSGNFSKPLATFQSPWQQLFCPKCQHILGNFCKFVRIYHFTSKIVLCNFIDIWRFLTGHTVCSPDARTIFRSIILRHETDFEETIEIRRIFNHPEFRFPRLYNDIAIGELSKSLKSG